MSIFVFSLLLASAFAAPVSDPLRVTLPQGTFTGITLNQTGFNIPLDAFLGIPYAQPPVGNLRLRQSLPVNASTNVYNATKFGFQCPQGSLVASAGPDTPGMSEDCLTINIFRPTGANSTNKALPVGINIHGGFFNSGAAKGQNVSAMVSWSGQPWIGISINYRLGAFGFLPSTLSAKEGALNLGLKDITLALQWVQTNIAKFGGDPKQVTLFGYSAGAHAIGHHVMNINKGHTALFQRVIMEDGAPTARKVPPYNGSLVEQQFGEFLQLTGCANQTNATVYSCLRAVPSDKFTNASVTMFNKYLPSTRYSFQPVVDGDFIRERPTKEWESGQWNKVPILTGFASDEGSIFVPQGMNTTQGFNDFFTSLLPQFNSTDMTTLENLYPDPLTNRSSQYLDTRPLPLGSEFERVTAAYGQYAYICPVITTAQFASAGQKPPVYLWHWATNMSATLGAFHVSQLPFESYQPILRGLNSTNALAQDILAYWTSFIATGDPNKVRTGLGQNRPTWGAFSNKGGQTMLFGQGNDQLAGGRNPGVTAQMQNKVDFQTGCAFWDTRSAKLER